MKKKLFSLLSILFLPVLGYSNCSGTPSTWTNGSTDQKWSTITNWNPSTCFPDGTTDSATFIDQANSISLDATITLGKINFTTTIGNITWDFSPNAPGDHFIFTGSASQINVTPTSSFFGITIDGDFVVPIVITNTNT
ncbi:MAG TPA: hypothetical protein VLG44_01330, partial [Chlamydiales bacterium]|nr:hypothetical protein [Chlamydiales bacterium]